MRMQRRRIELSRWQRDHIIARDDVLIATPFLAASFSSRAM
jgi:hypothetical protein